MKKAIRILLCLLLISLPVLASCGTDSKENRTENETCSEETGYTEEAFVFPGENLYLFHGTAQRGDEAYDNLGIMASEDTTESVLRLYMMRIASDAKDYQTYRETLVRIFPEADAEGFPEIPKEWFRDHCLFTLFMIDECVGDKITIAARAETGDGYYLILETDESKKVWSSDPDRSCATLLVPVDKEKSAVWKDVGLLLLGKDETLREPAEEKITALARKCSKIVEAGYRDAVLMQKGEDASEQAYLSFDAEGNIVSDGLYDDIVFGVRVRLKNDALLFPEEAESLKTYGDLMHFRNQVYEAFAEDHGIDGWMPDMAAGSGIVKDLESYVPEWHLYLPVTVPKLREILKDDRVAFVDLMDPPFR